MIACVLASSSLSLILLLSWSWLLLSWSWLPAGRAATAVLPAGVLPRASPAPATGLTQDRSSQGRSEDRNSCSSDADDMFCLQSNLMTIKCAVRYTPVTSDESLSCFRFYTIFVEQRHSPVFILGWVLTKLKIVILGLLISSPAGGCSRACGFQAIPQN